jgi:hypothetical protein
MNLRLTVPVQWSITLLLGLFLGYAYQPSAGSLAPAEQTPTPSVSATATSPGPFVTLPGGLLVRVKFFRNAAPQIEKIIHLSEARVAVLPKGTDRIEVLNQDGQALYAQSFVVEFLDGDPPKPVDVKTVIFVLPSMEGAVEVVVTTSNGKATHAIPAK